MAQASWRDAVDTAYCIRSNDTPFLSTVTTRRNGAGRAKPHYGILLGEIGAVRAMDMEMFKAWSAGDGPMFSVTMPFNQEAATVGNGVMVALAMPDRETVDRMYAKAIELGGTDEGTPGPRGGDDSGFYAGYFRDLDGNKLNFFHFEQP